MRTKISQQADILADDQKDSYFADALQKALEIEHDAVMYNQG